MYMQRLDYFLQYIHPLMMAQDQAKGTREPIYYGKFINQFWLDITTLIWQLERVNTKICRQKKCLLFNQISTTEEMLPK